MSRIDWKKIRADHEKNGLTIAQLAEKHGVKEGTIKSQKSRDARNGQPWVKATTKKVATKTEKLQPSQKAASSNNKKKRSGNPNPRNQFAERNSNPAFKHGIYSKFLPAEAQEIFDAIDSMSTADMLWDQIKIMYTNIMRAQSIMYVEDKDELIKELKREKVQKGKNPAREEEYELQFAWDRHAQALNAQARAMGELRTLINQFIRAADEADERRLKLEQMQLALEKTNAEIEKIQGSGKEGPIEIKIIGKKRE